MAANSRVYMAAVRYATFQKDRIALSRRDARIRECCLVVTLSLMDTAPCMLILAARQTCTGDLCDAYQPDTVFCENLGADGNGGYTWQVRLVEPCLLREFVQVYRLTISIRRCRLTS
jgi:hypothetical protein